MWPPINFSPQGVAGMETLVLICSSAGGYGRFEQWTWEESQVRCVSWSTNLGGKYQGPWRLPCWSWPRRRGRPGHCREAQRERLPSSTRGTWKIKTTLLNKKDRQRKRFELNMCLNLHGFCVYPLICTDSCELKFFIRAKGKNYCNHQILPKVL